MSKKTKPTPINNREAEAEIIEKLGGARTKEDGTTETASEVAERVRIEMADAEVEREIGFRIAPYQRDTYREMARENIEKYRKFIAQALPLNMLGPAVITSPSGEPSPVEDLGALFEREMNGDDDEED